MTAFESSEQPSRALARLSAAVIGVDDGHITYANAATEPFLAESAQAGQGVAIDEAIADARAWNLTERIEAAIDEAADQRFTAHSEAIDAPVEIRICPEGDGVSLLVTTEGETTESEADETATATRERVVDRQETAFRRLQEITASDDEFETKVEALLSFGAEHMGVEQGYFARLTDETQEIVVSAGENEQLQAGSTAPAAESYCRHTVAADEPVAVTEASEEGWDDDPAYQRFGLACYLGATISVDGEPYGTICFADRDPRETAFTDSHETFVELLAGWMSDELEQRERERQYRRLTERITSGYYALDTDWTITYWNDAMAERQGVPAESVVGENLWEQYPEIEDTVMAETLRKAMASGEPRTCEFYYEAGDYWTELQVFPDENGLSVLSTDITDRKAEQQSLRSRYDLAIDGANIGTWDWDIETDELQFNEQWATMLGYEQDDLAFEFDTWEELLHPDDREATLDALSTHVAGDTETYEQEFRLQTEDGGWQWVQALGRVVDRDADGEATRAAGIHIDINDRKRAETRLEAQEAILRQLTETTDDVFWLFDAEFSEIQFVNSAYEDVWGRSIADLEADSMDFAAGIHPDDRGIAMDAIERLQQGESTEAEYRVNAEEDFGRWVSVKGEPIYNDGEIVRVAGIARDITERKAREQELRRSERRFEAVVNDPQLLMAVLDTDGVIQQVNEKAVELAGADRATLEGAPFPETPWWDYDADLQADLRGWIDRAVDGEYVHYEADHPVGDDEWITAEGSLRPVTDGDGEVVALVVSATDVTARKRREEQLEIISETTKDLITATSPAAVAERVVDIAGAVLDDPVQVMWEYDAEADRLVPWRASEAADQLTAGDELAGIEPGSAEMAAFRDGSPRIVDDYAAVEEPSHPETSLSSMLLYPIDSDGLLVVAAEESGAFGATDRNLLSMLASHAAAAFQRAEREQALETYKNKLEESNENLQEFAYIASHDLKEPLRSVTSYLDLLESEYRDDLDDDAQFYIDRAASNASRMSSMIDALLQYSRVETRGEDFEAVDADSVFGETLEGLAVLRDETDAEIDAESLPTVTADRNQLGQLFQNLVKNAIQHGGDPPKIGVSVTDTGNAWEFAVADNGPGIAEQHHDRIFEIFQQATTDQEGGEGGIGLAICERIASRHGGEIWVESDTTGSTFKFTIPKEQRETAD
ncbi:PAS domain S-box protein [Halonotius roseus]|uniref:histidine kinase n=1 Tax=Halonotius roseus TaxID=2511997 RepID=A0A544QM11_9EURY|nr:PAS domain S-box protein [Halonotius roseus]TQQ79639.1 PAS domain S-box protein [Halonotius roseus]